LQWNTPSSPQSGTRSQTANTPPIPARTTSLEWTPKKLNSLGFNVTITPATAA
jgi:hypothetical protein